MKVKLLLNVSNLLKDGKVVPAGTVLELDDKLAAKQIARGLMVEVVDMVPAEKPKKEGLVSKMLKEKDKDKTRKIKKKK